MNQTQGKLGKPQSIGGAHKRVSDFDNPLTSNTVDLSHVQGSGQVLTGNSQKDN